VHPHRRGAIIAYRLKTSQISRNLLEKKPAVWYNRYITKNRRQDTGHIIQKFTRRRRDGGQTAEGGGEKIE
jgi:hypothetical protein